MSEKIETSITAQRTLVDLEKVITDSLPYVETAAFALLQIHDQKLYRQIQRMSPSCNKHAPQPTNIEPLQPCRSEAY